MFWGGTFQPGNFTGRGSEGVKVMSPLSWSPVNTTPLSCHTPVSADPDTTMEKTTPENWDDLHSVCSSLLKPGISGERLTDLYNQWAKKGYDEVRATLSVCVCVCVCVCVLSLIHI